MLLFWVSGNALNDYCPREKQGRTKQKLAYERIDLEKQQALNTAQSQAERNSIEKQAAIQKDKADREAFDKNKKLQIAQAKINLAMQLSNLAVVAFAPNPLNIATLGTAGIIMYAVQAALALAAFALNVGRINASTYAGGGKVKTLPNGRINETPNVPALQNGDNILIYAKRNEVILNEEQQKKLGGSRTFRALGVPGFAGGGTVKPLGSWGNWNNLQAPVNPSSFLNGSNSSAQSADILELKNMIGMVASNVNDLTGHVQTIKVQVVAREIDATNIKTKKANSIGSL